jgi:hypothetical protein
MQPGRKSSCTITVNPGDISDARPMACRHVGLDCGTCVRTCASRVASLCGPLGVDQQASVFFKLYPDGVCHRNLGRFKIAYGRALEESVAGDALDFNCAVA